MAQQLVAWLLLLLLSYGAAGAPSMYDCPDTGVLSSSRCNQTCFKAIGDALIGLYGGLLGSANPPVWDGLQPGSMCAPCTSNVSMSGAVANLPSYCCWPGVYCCSEDNSIVAEYDDPLGCWDEMPMGVHHLAMRGWNLSGSLSSDVVDSLVQLSQFGLRSMDLSSNALAGSIPRSIGRLKHMRSINLNLNRLVGTLPEELAQLEHLQHFYASFNHLSTPPASTEPLAGRFCMKDRTKLYSLILRANNFTGTVNMSHCEGLGLLDVQDNRFYGALPIGITNQKLISLRAANNQFNSSIPEALWRLPQLATLELANNCLTGTLSPYMGTVNNLVNIRLGNNSLRGTIPGNVTTNSQMLLLELYDNPLIYGTLPDPSKMVGIRTLVLRNTSISGTIPEALGTLPYLESVDVTLTRMLCCENQSQADALATQGIDRLLPSFLQFNNRMHQYDTTRNLPQGELDPDQPTDVLCGSVQRRQQLESEWNVMGLPITNSAVSVQKWSIGPLYSFYKNCTCTPAYVQDTDARVPVNITQSWCRDTTIPWYGQCVEAYIFKCALKQPPHLTLVQQVAVGIAVGFCIVLLLLVANLCMAHASKVRRYYVRAKTRLQGTPKHGRMSLVVTDIEGYSEIFKRAPEVMFRALVMHNSVIRAAKYANCGFVLEQEGDSFTLAFYNAFDAVAFCLQAQQALLAVQWPEGLGMDEPLLPFADSLSSRRPSRLQQRLSQLLTSGTRRRAQQTRSTASSTVSEGESMSLHHSPSRQLSQALASRLAGLKTPTHGPQLFSGLRVRMGICTGDVPSGTPIKSSALFQLAKVVSDFGNGGQIIMDHATFGAVKESLTVLGAVEATGINYQRLATHRSLWTTLKVMLGCTSPLAPAEEAVVLDMGAYYLAQANTTDQPAAFELACYPAPTDVRAADTEDQQRPDGCCRGWSACLLQLRRSASATSTNSNSNSNSRHGLSPAPSSAASASGMSARHPWGLVQLSALFRRQASSSSGGGSVAQSPLSATQQQQQSRPSALTRGTASCSSGAAPAAAAAGDTASANSMYVRIRSFRRMLSQTYSADGGNSSRQQRDWNNVRLFQVLPPALTGRAHVWHNQLNIKEGWRAYDMPYFDAPGSTAVALSGGSVSFAASSHAGCLSCGSPPTPPAASAVAGSVTPKAPSMGSADRVRGMSGSSTLLQQLPAVTMVFMSAENPEQLMRRRRSFTPKVQALLHQAVRDGLRRCGGYLCRVQEGDLRFMVAFASPVAALEWCLVVQEAAMYLPWPTEPVLLYEGCVVERDVQGRIIFRGPRIKMGVCEGVPSSIFPDHEGRADFHGPAVNMAARYADKGAKGGQIACSLDLALKVMAAWAGNGAGSPDSSYHCGAAAAAAAITTWCSLESAAGSSSGGGGGPAAGNCLQPLPLESCSMSVVSQQQQRQQQQQGPGLAGAEAEAAAAAPGDAHARSLPVAVPAAAQRSGSGSRHSLDGSSDVHSRSSFAGGLQGSWRQRSWSLRLSARGNSGSGTAAAAAGKTAASAPTSPTLPLSPCAEGPLRSAAQQSDVAAADACSRGPGPFIQGGSTAAGVDAGSLQLLGVGAQLHSIGSGIEVADVEKAQRLQKQQQQQPTPLESLWPCSPPSGRSSAAGTAAPASSRTASFKGHGSGQSPWMTQQQQQQLLQSLVSQQPVRLPSLRTGSQGLSASGAAAEAGAAQATFAMPNAARAPLLVEVHRLGLFAFKGGPPQQEMVQIVASHLLGRLDITARSTVAPSRKGQLLQKLEGRVGEPMCVQLPTLAQEYKAQLPERLLASPTRFPLSRGRAYVITDKHGGGQILQASAEGFSLPTTNSAPVEGTEQQQQEQLHHHVKWASSLGPEAGGASGGAAVDCRNSSGGGCVADNAKPPSALASLRVMSDTTSRVSAMPLEVGTPRVGGSSSYHGVRSSSDIGAATAASLPLPAAPAGCNSDGAAAVGVPGQLSTTSSKGSSITVRDHLSVTIHNGNASFVSNTSLANSREFELAPAAAASAAAASMSSSGGGGGHGSSILRHDSFQSVASGEGVDEQAGFGGLAACRSSKSGSSGVQSPGGCSEHSEQHLVAAGGGSALQQEMQQQQ